MSGWYRAHVELVLLVRAMYVCISNVFFAIVVYYVSNYFFGIYEGQFHLWFWHRRRVVDVHQSMGSGNRRNNRCISNRSEHQQVRYPKLRLQHQKSDYFLLLPLIFMLLSASPAPLS